MRHGRVGFVLLLALASCRTADERPGSVVRARDAEWDGVAAKRKLAGLDMSNITPSNGEEAYLSQLRK